MTEFREHMRRVSAMVAQWPKWKQELLGGTAKETHMKIEVYRASPGTTSGVITSLGTHDLKTYEVKLRSEIVKPFGNGSPTPYLTNETLPKVVVKIGTRVYIVQQFERQKNSSVYVARKEVDCVQTGRVTIFPDEEFTPPPPPLKTYIATVEYDVEVSAVSPADADNKILQSHRYDGCDYTLVGDAEWTEDE